MIAAADRIQVLELLDKNIDSDNAHRVDLENCENKDYFFSLDKTESILVDFSLASFLIREAISNNNGSLFNITKSTPSLTKPRMLVSVSSAICFKISYLSDGTSIVTFFEGPLIISSLLLFSNNLITFEFFNLPILYLFLCLYNYDSFSIIRVKESKLYMQSFRVIAYMGGHRVPRLNVYIRKENMDIVNNGKKQGIKPSTALIEGYKLLMGKTATYAILEEKRDILIKELTDVENQMDKIQDEIIIDPTSKDKVLKDLARCYINEGVILDHTLDIRRVELNLSLEDMKKLVKEKIIDPVDAGKITLFDVNNSNNAENAKNDMDLAKSYFIKQFEREGKFNFDDIKTTASRLNIKSDKLVSILEEEIRK